MNPQQPTLFDIEKERRTRRPFKRVRRSNNDLTPHLRFLRTYRMMADANGGKVKLKELQDKFRVGHFPRKALPTDLLTIDESGINSAYALLWKGNLHAYYTNCGRKPRPDDIPTLPTEVVVLPPSGQGEQPAQLVTDEEVTIAEIYWSLKRLTDSFVERMTTQINKLKSLNNL